MGFFLTLSFPSYSLGVDKKTTEKNIIKNSILFKLKKTTKDEYVLEVDKKFKTKSVLLSTELRLYKTTLPKNLDSEKAIKLFKETEKFEYVEADRVMKIKRKKI